MTNENNNKNAAIQRKRESWRRLGYSEEQIKNTPDWWAFPDRVSYHD